MKRVEGLCLAPDIQQAILLLPLTMSGHDQIRERHIRPITAIRDWRRQQHAWRRLMAEGADGRID